MKDRDVLLGVGVAELGSAAPPVRGLGVESFTFEDLGHSAGARAQPWRRAAEAEHGEQHFGGNGVEPAGIAKERHALL
jgi:hypothetical protein